jgi:hypothetical protein
MRRIAVTALVGLVGALVPHASAADAPPPAFVVSNFETATGYELKRDAACSVAIPDMPGYNLWAFGDTVALNDDGTETPIPYWPGTFLAISPINAGLVPTSLSELRPPPNPLGPIPNSNAPQPFLPTPTGLRLPDGVTPCGSSPDPDLLNLPISWPLGLTQGPAGPITLPGGGPIEGSQLVFMLIGDVCMVDGDLNEGTPWENWPDMNIQRVRLLAYDVSENDILSDVVIFDSSASGLPLPWQQLLFHPTFESGYLYAYTNDCSSYAPAFATCTEGSVSVARVPVASMGNPAMYEFRTASGWTNSYTQAADMRLPSTTPLGPILVDVHNFAGEGFILMEQTSFGGHYNLWQSATPYGPWQLSSSSRKGDCPSVPGWGCYQLWGHPELSTAGQLMYSHHSTMKEDGEDPPVVGPDEGEVGLSLIPAP